MERVRGVGSRGRRLRKTGRGLNAVEGRRALVDGRARVGRAGLVGT